MLHPTPHPSPPPLAAPLAPHPTCVPPPPLSCTVFYRYVGGEDGPDLGGSDGPYGDSVGVDQGQGQPRRDGRRTWRGKGELREGGRVDRGGERCDGWSVSERVLYPTATHNSHAVPPYTTPQRSKGGSFDDASLTPTPIAILIRHTLSPTHSPYTPPSQYGITALSYAKQKGHDDIVALLEAAMAAQTKVSQHITLTLPGSTTTNIGTVVHRCTLCMDQTN